jgi:DNA replication protein DnaC
MEKQIQTSLRELHLPSIRACYKEQSDLARTESYSYEQYLLNLIQYECQTRLEKRIVRFLKESKLPLEKTLSSFERKRIPQKVNAQLGVLLDGTFLDRSENILAFGNPGSGKTHLLCAIAQELIFKERRVLFRPCNLLVQEMLVAKRDLKLPQYLKRLAKYDAVIIDDIGYVQQNREEMEVLFTLLADRYERGSVMISSNLPFSKWEVIFKDPMTTAAAIDRLVHHSIILELNISSYRLEQSQQKRKSTEKSHNKGGDSAAKE